MTKEKYMTILQSALLADAHVMCLHWNYNQENIQELLKTKIDLQQLNAGKYSQYYPNKLQGDQSHHGDQILHLYNYLNLDKPFELDAYAQEWKKYISDYSGYIDSSSKNTLEHMSFDINPFGADSTDFCGISMGIPLLAHQVNVDNKGETIYKVIERISMTHNNTLTKDTAEWLINSILKIVEGHSIIHAMDECADTINNPVFQKIYHIGKTISSKNNSIPDLMQEVGLGCGIEVGLPILVVLLHRHHDNYMDFLIENTKAGADATSRALAGGALLGASSQTELPEHLLLQLRHKIL